jgi:putative transposase
MRGTRYKEEQIVALLKEHEKGVGTEELCRRVGVSQQTFYRWKAKYGGLELGDAQKLKALEDENRRLKRLVADLALDNAALKDVLSKNW